MTKQFGDSEEVENLNEEEEDYKEENNEEFDNVEFNEEKIMEKIEIKKEDIPKKRGRKSKKDNPTQSELNQMSDEEVIKLEPTVEEMYQEFNFFLEKTVGMIESKKERDIIPSGLDVLDAYLGGGFVSGTFSVIVGSPGSGKSTLGIKSIAKTQEKYNGKILIGYLDSEVATTKRRLYNLGVNNPPIKPFSESITIERVFKYIEGLCLFKLQNNLIDSPSLIIWDSIANTLSEAEMEVDDPNKVIGLKGRILSMLIPKYVSKIAEFNICLIAINQLRDEISIGGVRKARDLSFLSFGKTMPGGNAAKFNAFHLLEMKFKEKAEEKKYGFNGFISQISAVKNKAFTPNIPFFIAGNFKTGFSNFWTNYLFLVKQERILTSAWNSLLNMPERKFRTKEAEYLYKTDDVFRGAYDELVKDSIQKEIVEKYDPDIMEDDGFILDKNDDDLSEEEEIS